MRWSMSPSLYLVLIWPFILFEQHEWNVSLSIRPTSCKAFTAIVIVIIKVIVKAIFIVIVVRFCWASYKQWWKVTASVWRTARRWEMSHHLVNSQHRAQLTILSMKPPPLSTIITKKATTWILIICTCRYLKTTKTQSTISPRLRTRSLRLLRSSVGRYAPI